VGSGNTRDGGVKALPDEPDALDPVGSICTVRPTSCTLCKLRGHSCLLSQVSNDMRRLSSAIENAPT